MAWSKNTVNENVLHECFRKKEEQSEALKMWLLSITGLVAAEGRYHKNCSQNFFYKNSKSVERPVNATCDENFNAFSQCLEKEAEAYTYGEIHQKMVDLTVSKENAYNIKWMKKSWKIVIRNMLTLWQHIARQLKCASKI